MNRLVSAKFDEWPPSMRVRGEGEGRACEADERHLAVCARSSRIASSTMPSSSRGSKARSRSMSARERSGRSITGPSPAWKSKGMPMRIEGQQDVAEEDRGVDAEGAHGLQRDLDRELGGAAQRRGGVCRSRRARYSGM